MTDGIVKIHGKEYLTVAYRVSQFREKHPEWTIKTELVAADSDVVIMKAIIEDDGKIIGTGYAEEKRGSSQINRTSALENCETSAIGRALAACGFGGTEYASANEVENAIHQQNQPQRVDNTVEPDLKKVGDTVIELKAVVDADNPDNDEVAKQIREIVSDLSNDEKNLVWSSLREKAPNSGPQGRFYTTIINDYLRMTK